MMAIQSNLALSPFLPAVTQRKPKYKIGTPTVLLSFPLFAVGVCRHLAVAS
jgi:hypothetical protein